MNTKLFAAALLFASLSAQAHLSAPVSASSGLGEHGPNRPFAALQGCANTVAGERMTPVTSAQAPVGVEGRFALLSDKPDGLCADLAVAVQT